MNNKIIIISVPWTRLSSYSPRSWCPSCRTPSPCSVIAAATFLTHTFSSQCCSSFINLPSFSLPGSDFHTLYSTVYFWTSFVECLFLASLFSINVSKHQENLALLSQFDHSQQPWIWIWVHRRLWTWRRRRWVSIHYLVAMAAVFLTFSPSSYVNDVDDLLHRHNDSPLLGHVDSKQRGTIRRDLYLSYHPCDRVPGFACSESMEGDRLVGRWIQPTICEGCRKTTQGRTDRFGQWQQKDDFNGKRSWGGCDGCEEEEYGHSSMETHHRSSPRYNGHRNCWCCLPTVSSPFLSLFYAKFPPRMLAVMTMNVGYFLSVLGGIFLGSLALGRYAIAFEHWYIRPSW